MSAKEYYAYFKGIDPIKVGSKVLQKLVDSKGDQINVMNIEQTSGWKTAKDFGFISNPISNLIQRPEEISKQITHPHFTFFAPRESLVRVEALIAKDPQTIAEILIIATKRVVKVPAWLALTNIKFHDSRLVKEKKSFTTSPLLSSNE